LAESLHKKAAGGVATCGDFCFKVYRSRKCAPAGQKSKKKYRPPPTLFTC
jgi:hypothetical protein